MSDLEAYFFGNSGRQIHKWTHYFEIYERPLARFRGTDVHLLEFGVSHGGSLQMWKEYFGPKCKIFGVDINPECKTLEEDRFRIFIGDQGDRNFLRSLKETMPRVDILIDDGGHLVEQQINTFEELFPHVSETGLYLCEDCHSSYLASFGGGYKHQGSFIEYSKTFVDALHAWHSQSKRLKITEFTRSAGSVHFYNGVVVVEKKVVEAPRHLKTGVPGVSGYRWSRSVLERVRLRLKRFLRKYGFRLP